MLRALALALLLAACTSQPPVASGNPRNPPMPAAQEAQREEEQQPPPPPEAREVALICTAETVRFCPPRGCSESNPGFERAAPITMTTPNPGGENGRFCAGSDCQAALFQNFRDRDNALRAEIWTGQGWTRPEGALEIGASRTRFRLTKPASDGALIWRGVCQPAGS